MIIRFTPSKRRIRKTFLYNSGLVILWLILLCPVYAEQAPFKFEVGHLTEAVPGTFISVPVTKTAGTELMYGWDWLFAYDTTGLTFVGATSGVLFTIPGSYEWEYFTYRTSRPEACDEHCPPGLVQVFALAEAQSGPHQPLSHTVPDGTVLFTLNFQVKNTGAVDCGFFGIRYYWTDCGDNGTAYGPIEGVGLAVADSVFDINDINITDNSTHFPSYYGFPDACFESGAPNPPDRFENFINGGVDVQCLSPFSDRGDVNLNGVPYELQDRDVFLNYFLYGLSAFTVDPVHQTAVSDIKGDNKPLTVEDFVYLDRIIDTTLSPWPHAPVMTTDSTVGLIAQVETDSSRIIRTQLTRPGGALFVEFSTPGWQPGDYHINVMPAGEHLDLFQNLENDKLKIMVCGRRDLLGDQAEIDSVTLPAEPIDLFEIVYSSTVPEIDTAFAADYYGGKINLYIADVPNYPPGFNQYPSQLVNEPYRGFEFNFIAYDPNLPPDPVEYHLLSGPGEIDQQTGFWEFRPVCRDSGSTWILEVCASDLSHPCPQDEPTLHAVMTLNLDNPPIRLGDADFSGAVNLTDILFLIGNVYDGGPAPYPDPAVGDVNSDGTINLLDILIIIQMIYFDGPTPQCP